MYIYVDRVGSTNYRMSRAAAMLPILIIVLPIVLPNNAVSSHSFNKLRLPIGSEAYAFDSHNLGPYTGLNDGRIIKYVGPTTGFLDFATTSPNR